MKKGVLFLSLALVFLLAGCGSGDQAQNDDPVKETLSTQEAKAKTQQFINDKLLANSQQEAEVTKITEERGMYKATVKTGGREIESYITKDGKKFFPEAMDTEEQTQDQGQNSNSGKKQPAPTVSEKTETPEVELFVMSHCPYGTQMEKAILPVVKELGNEINFDLKFCDYAMHKKKELDEQMRQHCIKQEQPNKLITYLDCFLANQDSQQCMNEANIDQNTIQSCVDRVDKEYKITEKYNDKSTWKNGRFPVFPVYAEANKEYGISGSPALVINGEEVQAPRNPNGLLETVCSAFKEAPEECDQELSTATPSPGFGSGSSNSGSSGGNCG